MDYTVINPITTFSFLASHHALKDMFLRFNRYERKMVDKNIYGVQAVWVIGARLGIRSGEKVLNVAFILLVGWVGWRGWERPRPAHKLLPNDIQTIAK